MVAALMACRVVVAVIKTNGGIDETQLLKAAENQPCARKLMQALDR
jgi:hypothetical protein